MQSLFDLLYTNAGAGWLTIWTLPDRCTRWFEISDLAQLDATQEYALQRSGEGADVYFGVGLRRQKLTPQKPNEMPRGSAEDVSVLPALFADIDVRDSEAHKKTSLPATREEAIAFLEKLPLHPTATVWSGHGIHAYWLLKEPVFISNQKEQRAAALLLAGWADFINSQAVRIGWYFDNVSELARVLRVPGTLNHKGVTPSPVELSIHDTCGYDISEFKQWIDSIPPEWVNSIPRDGPQHSAPAPAPTGKAMSPDEELVAQYYQRSKTEIPAVLPEGERNTMLFKLAASMRAKGLTDVAIEAALLAENAARCVPPLEEKEVLTIARSASKYQPGTSAEVAQAAAVAQLQEVGDTAQDILADATLDAIAAIENEVERYRQIATLRLKAKKLGIIKDFEAAIKAKLQQANAQRAAANAEEAAAKEIIELEGIPLQGLRRPRWNVAEDGIKRVRYVDGEPIASYACPHPMIITERLLNVDTAIERLHLAFKRDGAWHDVAVNRSVAASKTSIVQLADTGIMVNTENAKHLVQFLHDLETANLDVIPRRRSVGRAGWIGNDTFSPYNSDVVFDGELSYRDLYNSIRPAGDARKWLDAVSTARDESLAIRIVLAASFAAPLVGLLGRPIFFLHLWGDTGTGKSVALHLAESVWGNPMVLTRTFNNTPVGLERAAAFMHSLPLALDEFQTLQRAKFDVDNLLYTLVEGKSKGRGTRGGGMEIETRWANIIITNGEEPMTTDHSGGGAKNRAIEIEVAENLFKDAPAFADLIHENYGHAGMKYISCLIDEVKANGLREIRGYYESFRNTYNCFSGFTDKQACAMALICTGDYYASRYVWDLSEDNAFDQATKLNMDVMPMMATTKDVDQVQRAWDYVQGWLASNKDRFIGWGHYALLDSKTPIAWYGDYDDGKLYVIKGILDEVLINNKFSPRKCASGWTARKLTVGCMDGEKIRHTVKHRIMDVPTWCYCFKVIDTLC